MSRAKTLLDAARIRIRTNEAKPKPKPKAKSGPETKAKTKAKAQYKPKPGDVEKQDGSLFLTGSRGVEIDVERRPAGKLLFGFSERGKNIGSLEMTKRQAQALSNFLG